MLWSIPHRLVAGMAISTPAVEGNRLAVSTQYEGTLMLEFTPGAASPKILWKASAGSVPERQWKKAGFNTTMSTVLLLGGHVYGVSLYGETCCLDGNTGRRVWTTLQPTSGGTVPRERWCTVFMVPHGDKVFIFNEKGDLILARLTPSGYQEIGRDAHPRPGHAVLGRRAARSSGRIRPLPTAASTPATTTRSSASRSPRRHDSGHRAVVVQWLFGLSGPRHNVPDERPMPRIPSMPPVVPAGNATIRFSAAGTPAARARVTVMLLGGR